MKRPLRYSELVLFIENSSHELRLMLTPQVGYRKFRPEPAWLMRRSRKPGKPSLGVNHQGTSRARCTTKRPGPLSNSRSKYAADPGRQRHRQSTPKGHTRGADNRGGTAGPCGDGAKCDQADQ
jgi:hypothetical protein